MEPDAKRLKEMLEAAQAQVAKLQAQNDEAIEAARVREAEAIEAARVREAELQAQNDEAIEAARVREAEAIEAARVREAEAIEAARVREAELQAQNDEAIEAARVREAELQAQNDEAIEAARVREAELQAQNDEAIEAARVREAELQAQNEAIEAARVREAELQAQIYLSNSSILLKSFWSHESTYRNIPAKGQTGPVGKLYLENGMKHGLEKDATFPFDLVDVPDNNQKCGLLLQEPIFSSESDVQSRFREVLTTLFSIAAESLKKERNFELSAVVNREISFGGFGGRVDLFAYFVTSNKAIPCLVCEVKSPRYSALDDKVDDKVVMQALKYLVSVHIQTGCGVVFGLISTYETTHVIWMKKRGLKYNFNAEGEYSKGLLEGLGSSSFLPGAPVEYPVGRDEKNERTASCFPSSKRKNQPDEEEEGEELTLKDKQAMVKTELDLWQQFDVRVSKGFKREQDTSQDSYVKVLYNVVLQSIKATLFTRAKNHEKTFCEVLVGSLNSIVCVPRPIKPTHNLFPVPSSKSFHILDHIHNGQEGFRVCSAMYVTKTMPMIGKFCMLKLRYSVKGLPRQTNSYRETLKSVSARSDFDTTPPNAEEITIANALYVKRLENELTIWNLLSSKSRLPKAFIVEDICGYRLLVMPYLFPLTEWVKKNKNDYVDNFEEQIKAQVEFMWNKGWVHGDLELRHVGLWSKSVGKSKPRVMTVQLFDFGNARRKGEKDTKETCVDGELDKLSSAFDLLGGVKK